MHLPWLQVNNDAFMKCANLGRLLGVPETQGLGIGMHLWLWAFELAPDGDFTGRVPDVESVAAAVGWPVADAKRLLIELQRVGFIAVTPYLRVRGLDRYRRAWEKNRRKSKGSKSGDAVPESGTDQRGTGAPDADADADADAKVLPPTPPLREGGERKRRRSRGRDLAPPEVHECVACGKEAASEVAGVWLCYGGGCSAAGNAWAQQQNPQEPFRADVASWARARRTTDSLSSRSPDAQEARP